jgi:hypothetical protein
MDPILAFFELLMSPLMLASYMHHITKSEVNAGALPAECAQAPINAGFLQMA